MSEFNYGLIKQVASGILTAAATAVTVLLFLISTQTAPIQQDLTQLTTQLERVVNKMDERDHEIVKAVVELESITRRLDRDERRIEALEMRSVKLQTTVYPDG